MAAERFRQLGHRTATKTAAAFTRSSPPGGRVAARFGVDRWRPSGERGMGGRAGWVESIRLIVQRTEGNPAAGAVAGALIGGLLFGGGRGPAAVAGAVGGAAVGAAASQGRSEQRSYEIIVRFDDGGYGTFVYGGYSPFRPGERVVVTPGGLARGQ
jgi:outer membrane lipoprotein SlyB